MSWITTKCELVALPLLKWPNMWFLPCVCSGCQENRTTCTFCLTKPPPTYTHNQTSRIFLQKRTGTKLAQCNLSVEFLIKLTWGKWSLCKSYHIYLNAIYLLSCWWTFNGLLMKESTCGHSYGCNLFCTCCFCPFYHMYTSVHNLYSAYPEGI